MIVTFPDIVTFLLKSARMAATFLSYLRLPVLLSSGLAAIVSGLLYFKQK